MGNIVANIDKNYRWFSLKYPYHFLGVYRCVAIQLLRTPKGKKMLLNLYEEVYKKKYSHSLENVLFAQGLFKILNENMQSTLLELILNEYSHISIGINETDIPIISSDNPVVALLNLWNKDETMIYYPITPKRCLFLVKRTSVDSQLKNVMKEFLERKFVISDFSDITQEAYNREKMLFEKTNPESTELSREDILVLNIYIAKFAERFIIANQNMEHKSFWIVM